MKRILLVGVRHAGVGHDTAFEFSKIRMWRASTPPPIDGGPSIPLSRQLGACSLIPLIPYRVSIAIGGVLDSMNGIEDRKRPADEDFIAASTWQGSKPGYYFGTAEQGTGYYRDGPSPALRKKRSVGFAEDRNETVLVPKAEDLLAQAEASTTGQTLLTLSPHGIRKAATKLQQAVAQNELQRSTHADDPSQYMDSEVQLYECLHSWQALAAEPSLYTVALEETDVVDQFAALLAHPNPDVVSTVLSVWVEWMDPSLLMDDDDEVVRPVVSMVSTLLRDGAEYLVGNLSRLQVPQEDDEVGRGVDDALTIVENWMEADNLVTTLGIDGVTLIPTGVSVAAHLAKETPLVAWLLQQISNEDSAWRGRALEVLAAMAPREDLFTVIPDWTAVTAYQSNVIEDGIDGATKQDPPIDAVETLLQVVAAFRKQQPSDETELDRLENATIILASLLTYSTANLQAFLDAQGIELVVRCLKERVHAGGASLAWLDFEGAPGNAVLYEKACSYLVHAGCLKLLLPFLFNKHLPKRVTVVDSSKKADKEWQRKLQETTLRILYALTRYLTPTSPHDAQQRLIAKFASDVSKCDRLVELLLKYYTKAKQAEFDFFRSDQEESLTEAEVALAVLQVKLDGGAEFTHRIAAVLAFLCQHSQRCHSQILDQLHQNQVGMSLVRKSLEEFASVLAEEGQIEQIRGYLNHI